MQKRGAVEKSGAVSDWEERRVRCSQSSSSRRGPAVRTGKLYNVFRCCNRNRMIYSFDIWSELRYYAGILCLGSLTRGALRVAYGKAGRASKDVSTSPLHSRALPFLRSLCENTLISFSIYACSSGSLAYVPASIRMRNASFIVAHVHAESSAYVWTQVVVCRGFPLMCRNV